MTATWQGLRHLTAAHDATQRCCARPSMLRAMSVVQTVATAVMTSSRQTVVVVDVVHVLQVHHRRHRRRRWPHGVHGHACCDGVAAWLATA